MHIAFITAGGAGMFCGSCMQDNALARALMRAGCEVSFLPTYTPLRLDQEAAASGRVFLGGINLYLDNQIPGWRYLPKSWVSWLNHPKVLHWATSFGIENDASKLGGMTLAMLNGAKGTMVREYQELVDFLIQLQPDVIIFSNALLSGILPLLRKKYTGPLCCLLQGDDLFLDQLTPAYRQQACDLITQHAQLFDRFLTHSTFYADYMSRYLALDRTKFVQLPLAIDLPEALTIPNLETSASPLLPRENQPHRIGYFARIAPEKGLLELVHATRELHEQGVPVELRAGGYLGKAHLPYMKQVEKEAAFLGNHFQYLGSPDSHAEKMAQLQTFDLLSVPTLYQEPKGLYVLEAMAAGVPVVLPAHGNFPELVASTGAGLTYPAGNRQEHALAMRRILDNPHDRQQFSHLGRQAVTTRHTSQQAALALIKICEELIPPAGASTRTNKAP